MQVDRLDIIGVRGGGVAGAAHEADDVPGLDQVAFFQALREGSALLQVGIIIVAPGVRRTDAHPPAAVLIPAQGLYDAALHGDNGGSQTAHQVVAQVLAPEAVAAAHAEIVAMAVSVSGGNGGEGLQAVSGPPFAVDLDGVAAQQPAQQSIVGGVIIGKQLFTDAGKLRRGLIAFQVCRRFFHRGQGTFSPGAAGGHGQNVDPAQVRLLLKGGDVLVHGIAQGSFAHGKIHPFDAFCPHIHHAQGTNQQKKQYPPTHLTHLLSCVGCPSADV